jgi:hypothetical protein
MPVSGNPAALSAGNLNHLPRKADGDLKRSGVPVTNSVLDHGD